MYWQIGKRIFEEEQGGEEGAEYDSKLLKFLSESCSHNLVVFQPETWLGSGNL